MIEASRWPLVIGIKNLKNYYYYSTALKADYVFSPLDSAHRSLHSVSAVLLIYTRTHTRARMHARTYSPVNVGRMRNVEARRTDITRLIENLSMRALRASMSWNLAHASLRRRKVTPRLRAR